MSKVTRTVKRVFEGKWDCSHCLTSGIAGRLKACPECGDPRNPTLNPEERPYLPTDANELSDSDVQEHFGQGPDWNCGHCDTANKGNTKVCSYCNKPRDSDDTATGTRNYVSGSRAEGISTFDTDSSDEDRVEDELTAAQRVVDGNGQQPRVMPDKIFKQSDIPRSAWVDPDDEVVPPSDTFSQLTNDTADLLSTYRKPLLIGVGAVALVGLVFGSILLFNFFLATKPQDLTITALDWERKVEIEELRTFTETGWSIPSGGREISRERAVHHYETVIDGYETVTTTDYVTVQVGTTEETYACGTSTVDNGDGSFSSYTDYCTRSVPVYEQQAVERTEQVPITHEEPVYRTRYTYEIDRWVHDRYQTASGSQGEPNYREPYWPEVTGLAVNQRVSGLRLETYTVELVETDGEKRYSRDVELSIWQNLRIDERVVGHVTRSGSLRSVDWVVESANA